MKRHTLAPGTTPEVALKNKSNAPRRDENFVRRSPNYEISIIRAFAGGDVHGPIAKAVRLNALKSSNNALAQGWLLNLQQSLGNSHVRRVLRTSKAKQAESEVHSDSIAGPEPMRFLADQAAAGSSQPILRKITNTLIQRTDGESTNIQNLRRLLQRDQEGAAIQLMGRLSREDVSFVLESREFKELAVSAFGNDEMYRGVRAMRGDLYRSLEWMFDEGTDWEKLRDVIRRAPAGHARVRADNWMKDQFVSEINDAQMCAVVDLLGGSLLWKLSWMYAEGVSSWERIRAKLAARGVTEAQKRQVRRNRDIQRYFVSKLNDGQMFAAVELLGGNLLWKLSWLLAEAVSVDYIYRAIRSSPDAELRPVVRDASTMRNLRRHLSSQEYTRASQMLRQGLLYWGDVDRRASERHYERDTATSPWELETFRWTTAYEIRYTRTQLKVIVRIKLRGTAVPAAQRTRWINGIKNRWNNQFHIVNSRRLAVVFEPVFTSRNFHHTLRVHGAGAACAREDMTNWCITTSGDTAAHEFGHMVGLEDEYRLTAADYRRLTGTAPPAGPAPAGGYTWTGATGAGSLMGTAAGPVEGRHLRPFVAWLNRHRRRGERPYRLVAGP